MKYVKCENLLLEMKGGRDVCEESREGNHKHTGKTNLKPITTGLTHGYP